MLSLVIQYIDFQNVHVEFSKIKNLAYCKGLLINAKSIHTKKKMAIGFKSNICECTQPSTILAV